MLVGFSIHDGDRPKQVRLTIEPLTAIRFSRTIQVGIVSVEPFSLDRDGYSSDSGRCIRMLQ